MADSFVPLTQAEQDALAGLFDPQAFVLYMTLRFSMDWKTGVVGRTTKISASELMWRLSRHTTRGKGTQIERCTLEEYRGSVRKLERMGMIVRVGNSETLSFLLPLARVAKPRPKQTQHEPNRVESTEHNTEEASNGAGFEGIHHSLDFEQIDPNPTHIKMVDMCTPPQSSSTAVNGVDAGDAAARGVNQDRPQAASQAGSACCRPGNPHETSNRDRPAASHPAPAGRSERRALPGGANTGQGSSDALSGYAAGESDSADALNSDVAEAVLRPFVEVLRRRAVRVPRQIEALQPWADLGATVDTLEKAIATAFKYREKQNSMQPVTVAYLTPIIQTVLSEQRAEAQAAMGGPKAGRRRRRSSMESLNATAADLGITPAWPGESPEHFRERVQAAVDAQEACARG